MTEIVAKTELIGRRPGEEPFTIVVEIGKPYLRGEDPEEWWCPVSLSPLYERIHDAVGGDALQSLCLAVSLALDLLEGFKEKGGSLTHKEGSEFPLEAYAFGAAIKKQKSA